jgi:hypothetical protein
VHDEVRYGKRARMCVLSIGDNMLVMGGTNSTGEFAFNDVWISPNYGGMK